MQYLENDMDDLFQRAAENYPLKTGEGDWETITDRLTPTPEKISPVRLFKNRVTKELLVLVLLFSSLTIGKSALQSPKSGLSSLIRNNLTTHSLVNNYPLKQEDVSIRWNTLIHNKRPITESLNVTANRPQKADQKIFYLRSNNKKSSKIFKQNDQLQQSVNENDRTQLLLFTPLTGRYNVDYLAVHKNMNMYAKNENFQRLNESLKKIGTAYKSITQETGYRKLLKRKVFYIGVAAGSDFSKVHSVAFNNSGFNAGLLAGIKFAGRTSFETGILWNRKNYNSAGNEFKMDKIGSTMPAGMVINSVEGKSSLIEIPLKIKYDFLNRANTTWFAAVGISAYIMTTESNRYHVTMNGNTEMMTGVYRNYSYGLPAVASISAGYQKNLSKFINVRIEPFLKIPLTGMGVGNLPITSAGLQVGITRILK
jgi:hypothetical protein